MVNVTGKKVKKRLEKDGWACENAQGDHVECSKNEQKVDFEGQSGKYLSMKSIDKVKEAVEAADGVEFKGNKDFEQWVKNG